MINHYCNSYLTDKSCDVMFCHVYVRIPPPLASRLTDVYNVASRDEKKCKHDAFCPQSLH